MRGDPEERDAKARKNAKDAKGYGEGADCGDGDGARGGNRNEPKRSGRSSGGRRIVEMRDNAARGVDFECGRA